MAFAVYNTGMSDDVELVREKIDLVQLISEYTPLTQIGRNFKGVCPFHQEKTPSFFVRPERGLWYCFGCQRGGDVFTFLMEKENLSFGEALEVLAKRAGVTLSRKQDKHITEKKERVYTILSRASDYFHSLLIHPQHGRQAQDYLSTRGISEPLIETFSIGYSPDSWDQTLTYLKQQQFSEEDIIAAGLAITSEKGRIYDRFRGRIMFPIWDHLGRIVGFSGRVLAGDQTAKYINSPETMVFKKGHVLYGYHLAQDAAQKAGYIILVEGNLDVVSVVGAGITHVVAPLGTGLTHEQIKLLKRISSRILLVYDNDEAGRHATHRAILEATHDGFEVKVATLSTSKDPDEAVRQNKAQFIKDLKNAVSAFQYLVSDAKRQSDSANAFGKKKIAEALFTFIHRTPDEIVRESYLDQLGRELDIPQQAIRKDYESWRKEHQDGGRSPMESDAKKLSVERIEKKGKQELIEDYFISLLFNLPQQLLVDKRFQEIVDSLDSSLFTQDFFIGLIKTIKTAFQEKSGLTAVIQSLSEEEQKRLDLLLLKDFGSIVDNVEAALKEVKRVLRLLSEAFYRGEIKELTKQKGLEDKSEAQKQEINDKIKEITEKFRALDDE